MRTIVVIPAYNEALRIGVVVRKVKKLVPEVIVIDDGSSDDTSKVVQKAGAEIVRLPRNRGLGYATRQGMKLAYDRKADVIITMDGDGQHLPEELPLFLEIMSRDYDVAFGYRTTDSWKMSFHRMILNRGTNFIVKLMTGHSFRDSLCGYRGFSRRAVERLELHHDRHPFVPGIAINTALLSLKYTEISISCVYNNKRSSYRYPDFLGAFGVYLHFLWGMLLGKYRTA